MSSKSYEWNNQSKSFTEVDDPIDFKEGFDVDECIHKTGYIIEMTSALEECTNAAITVYSTERKDKPLFYIDIMGQNTGIATFVARDPLMLLETLKQIHPLINLLGLDQVANHLIQINT